MCSSMLKMPSVHEHFHEFQRDLRSLGQEFRSYLSLNWTSQRDDITLNPAGCLGQQILTITMFRFSQTSLLFLTELQTSAPDSRTESERSVCGTLQSVNSVCIKKRWVASTLVAHNVATSGKVRVHSLALCSHQCRLEPEPINAVPAIS